MADEQGAGPDVDTIIESADKAFAVGDYRTASAGWETAFASEEAQDDPELKNDLAWNIGLAEAAQGNLDRSKWYLEASGYGRDHFVQTGVPEVYDAVFGETP